MDFNLTEEQEMFRREVRRFAEKEVTPLVDKMDKEDEFPHEIRPKFAEMNLYGILYPSEYGGIGADYVILVLALEEIAKILPALGIHLQLQYVVVDELYKYGTEEQKQKLMIPIIQGKKIGCFAFTEPDTGSDPKMIRTRARLDGGGYVLNGTKRFITHAPFADIALIFAKDDKGDISLFIVETEREGFSTGKVEDKLGLRGATLSDINLENVRIPKGNLLGGKGGKFQELKEAMTLGKLCLSAQCLGIMEAGMEEAIEYAKNRIQRGRPILEFRSTHCLLAEMASKIEACRWLTYRSAFVKDQGVDTIKDMAITKLFVTQTAVDVLRYAVQVHGAYGIIKDYKVERLFRDAKMYELLEGTSEVQRELIAPRLV